MGNKTWTPGKTLQRLITATFGIQPKEQQQIVQACSDAVADVAPQVLQVLQGMAKHPGFADVGQRMLLARAEGVHGLRDERVNGMGAADLEVEFDALEKLPKLKVELSPFLGKR